MNDEVEFIYNTRQRSGKFDTEFYERLAAALSNDIERERVAEEGEEIDPFLDDNDDNDVDYVPSEDDASVIENEIVIEANEIFDSDDSDEKMQSEAQQSTAENCFYGKDGTKWDINEPNVAVRVRQHNIMRFQAGPKEQNSIPIEVFKKFFTPNIVLIIITETNRYGKGSVQKWNVANPDKKQKVWKDVTESELDAFIAILLAAGVSHNNIQS